jgi:hypothetical protein
MAATFAIASRGPFSLAAAASFGFGPTTGVPPVSEEFLILAEPWRPFRTWGAVLLQLAARRAGVV